jgi:hypothetical protein
VDLRKKQKLQQRGEKLMQLHVRVRGFDNEGFAHQLAAVYTADGFCAIPTRSPLHIVGAHDVEAHVGSNRWIIGEHGGDLIMVNMIDDGYEDNDWVYFRLEFGERLAVLGPERLRQMLLAYVPGAQFFDLSAPFDIRDRRPRSTDEYDHIVQAAL